MSKIQEKGIIEWITERVTEIFNLEALRPKLTEVINSQYNKGIERVEVQLDMNFIPERENLKILEETMYDNIQNQGMEIAHNIKGELQRWKLNDENLSQAKKRIKDAMKNKDWDYKIKRVIRTETLRANNVGSLDAAKQSNIKLKKWLDVTMDNVTSDICKKEHSKYGSPDKAIDLDKEFIVTVGNKTYRAQSPPFHVNCRTILRYKRVRE